MKTHHAGSQPPVAPAGYTWKQININFWQLRKELPKMAGDSSDTLGQPQGKKLEVALAASN